MGHDTYNRVWDSDARHPRRILLLALARYADARGVSWPKVDTLAAMTRLYEGDEIGADRYIRRLIAEAIADGDLIHKLGGGRGVPSIYGITIGLNDQERRELRRIVAATVIRKNQRYLVIGGEEKLYTKDPAAIAALEAELLAEPEAQNPVLQTRVTAERGETVESPPPPPKPRKGGTPRHVAYLMERGMGAAHLTADWDTEATIADYEARMNDPEKEWTNGTIWNAWKIAPPTPENIYGRHAQKDQPERPTRTTASKAKPKPGDRDYYRRGR